MVVTAQSFPPLPEAVLVSMRVHYTADCPEEFVSDGFELADGEAGFSIDPAARLRFDIGGVATHHDALKFTLCTRDDSDSHDEQSAHDLSCEPTGVEDDQVKHPEIRASTFGFEAEDDVQQVAEANEGTAFSSLCHYALECCCRYRL
eukprot:TRINITY_DN11297_c0_g1_i1.p2 TRINITY_DN11297_c0_g1~~TRINITY_DN11297_c0_g1_i1.p2  ORF type:complete len:147 (-),score=21.04 TRINITY_DN11297_c0_g1_i1:2536-2976(-)